MARRQGRDGRVERGERGAEKGDLVVEGRRRERVELEVSVAGGAADDVGRRRRAEWGVPASLGPVGQYGGMRRGAKNSPDGS